MKSTMSIAFEETTELHTQTTDTAYHVHVSMTPNVTDNSKKPYFWSLKKLHKDGSQTNECSGWEETPMLAWESALTFYKMFKDPSI